MRQRKVRAGLKLKRKMIEEKLRKEILGKAKRKKMRGRGDGKMTDEDAEDNIHRIL